MTMPGNRIKVIQIMIDKKKSSDTFPKIGLEPINRLTMAETVEKRLQGYFRDNGFNIGDRLPKEIELSEALGVSRNVIREALSRFRMLGLIESKKKRGMVLSSPDILGGMERVLHPKFLDMGTLKDILEMRLTLEMGMAELIFIYKTDKDVKDLEKIVSKKKKKVDMWLGIGPEFFGRLYQITRNGTMERFQRLLLSVSENMMGYERDHDLHLQIDPNIYGDILVELRNGTPESYRKMMKGYLTDHFEKIRKWDSNVKDPPLMGISKGDSSSQMSS